MTNQMLESVFVCEYVDNSVGRRLFSWQNKTQTIVLDKKGWQKMSWINIHKIYRHSTASHTVATAVLKVSVNRCHYEKSHKHPPPQQLQCQRSVYSPTQETENSKSSKQKTSPENKKQKVY